MLPRSTPAVGGCTPDRLDHQEEDEPASGHGPRTRELARCGVPLGLPLSPRPTALRVAFGTIRQNEAESPKRGYPQRGGSRGETSHLSQRSFER